MFLPEDVEVARLAVDGAPLTRLDRGSELYVKVRDLTDQLQMIRPEFEQLHKIKIVV